MFGAAKPQGSSLFGGPQAPQQQQPSNSIGQNTGLFGTIGQNQQQPAGGLFGQPQQQQPAGGLFGQPSQQQQPAGGLFGQPSQQQQPAGGLFGQPPQQQQPSGGLFGQPTQQQQQQPSGLFGQPAQQQPAGGLFGQSTQQQQPASLFGQPTGQQQQQPTGGLFGQPNQQPTGSLFGQIQQQQQQSTQSTFGPSIFGNTQPTNNNQQQAPGGGLFGGANAPQQQTGLFGNNLQSHATVPAGGFGGGGAFGGTSIFGNKTQPQQSTLGFSNTNQQSSAPLFTKSTKFNDLPDDTKRTLESLESHIQGRMQISKDLHQRKLGDEPTKGHDLIRGLHKELVNTSTTIRNDLHFTKDIKAKVEQAVQDTIVATRIVDGFRNPQGGGGSGAGYLKDHAGFPLEYFTRVTEQMKERLAWYKSTIEQIERKLSSSAGQAQTPQGISATLQAQHATFLSLAGKTAALDADLQKIKTLYTQIWRTKTGSVRDPFNEIDITLEAGLGNMNVK